MGWNWLWCVEWVFYWQRKHAFRSCVPVFQNKVCVFVRVVKCGINPWNDCMDAVNVRLPPQHLVLVFGCWGPPQTQASLNVFTTLGKAALLSLLPPSDSALVGAPPAHSPSGRLSVRSSQAPLRRWVTAPLLPLFSSQTRRQLLSAVYRRQQQPLRRAQRQDWREPRSRCKLSSGEDLWRFVSLCRTAAASI